MKKRTTKKESQVDVIGAKPDDVTRVRQCLKELGRSQAWLAKEAGLSLIMVNSFLNGKKNLSSAAGDRIMLVINAAFSEKKVAGLDEKVTDLEKDAADQVQHDYDALVDVRKAIGSKNTVLSAREALISLAGPPRDPAAYEVWKARQVELHEAAEELPHAKEWIKHIEEQRDNLLKQISGLEREVSLLKEIKSHSDEMISLYAGLVKRLKKQLSDAGLEPTE